MSSKMPPQKRYIWLPFLFGFFVIIFIQKEVGREISQTEERENPLDDCNFVYLDMGTNFGVQIR